MAGCACVLAHLLGCRATVLGSAPCPTTEKMEEMKPLPRGVFGCCACGMGAPERLARGEAAARFWQESS
jgi:hypothetical protein